MFLLPTSDDILVFQHWLISSDARVISKRCASRIWTRVFSIASQALCPLSHCSVTARAMQEAYFSLLASPGCQQALARAMTAFNGSAGLGSSWLGLVLAGAGAGWPGLELTGLGSSWLAWVGLRLAWAWTCGLWLELIWAGLNWLWLAWACLCWLGLTQVCFGCVGLAWVRSGWLSLVWLLFAWIRLPWVYSNCLGLA